MAIRKPCGGGVTCRNHDRRAEKTAHSWSPTSATWWPTPHESRHRLVHVQGQKYESYLLVSAEHWSTTHSDGWLHVDSKRKTLFRSGDKFHWVVGSHCLVEFLTICSISAVSIRHWTILLLYSITYSSLVAAEKISKKGARLHWEKNLCKISGEILQPVLCEAESSRCPMTQMIWRHRWRIISCFWKQSQPYLQECPTLMKTSAICLKRWVKE